MTYEIDKINKSVLLEFEKNSELRKKVKDVSGNAHFNPALKKWVIPFEKHLIKQISKLIKENGFKKADTKEEQKNDFDYSISEADFNHMRELCNAQNFSYSPRDYQIEALHYALKKGTVFNGDDVGLGKTFESIMYAEISSSFPCLVVVPASVKYNWFEKWQEIVGKKRSISVIESKSDSSKFDSEVVIINYDILAKKVGKSATEKFKELTSIDWKMVIFDEAHFLKNDTSQRSVVAEKIAKKVDLIQMLSGTITMSRPAEMWNLLKIAKLSDSISDDWFRFITRYCGGYRGSFGWVTSGATNTIELNEKMRENFYIRREKRDVIKDLPDSIKQVLKVKISNKKAIEKATNDFITFVQETRGEEAVEAALGAEHLVKLGVLRKLAADGKMKAIEGYLNDWKQSGKKLLVFGIHREGLDHLSKKYKCPIIQGGISSKKKQEIVNDWKKSEDLFLFANIQSAGTGVDGLQESCSNMVIYELPWKPSDLTQVIGRIDRLGQTSVTAITFLLSFETIDLEMWDMLQEKEAVTEAVNKGIDISKSNSGMKNVVQKLLKK